MSSSQINFYLMEEDVQKINEYIVSQNFLIVSDPMPEMGLNLVSSLTGTSNRKVHRFFILRKEDEEKIETKFISRQKYYTINETNSPVIEFIPSEIINNKFYRGRIYYIKKNYGSNGQLIEKDSAFLKAAGDLFKWIKKNIKNVKYTGFEDFLVSEKTINWVKENKGILLLNNIDPEKNSLKENSNPNSIDYREAFLSVNI